MCVVTFKRLAPIFYKIISNTSQGLFIIIIIMIIFSRSIWLVVVGHDEQHTEERFSCSAVGNDKRIEEEEEKKRIL